MPNSGLTFEEAYQRTMQRQAFLEGRGIAVEVLWECELKQQLKQDDEMQRFFDSIELVTPLDCRDGLFGGRYLALRSSSARPPLVLTYYFSLLGRMP